jgi:membrane associated rhomboid family serine protease
MSLPPPPPPGAPVPGAARPAGPIDTAVCYRHADRATGRRCTRCGRPACGECLVQAPVGSNCLECVKAAKPDAATRAKYWSAGQPILVTWLLIAANLAVFVWVVAQEPSSLTSRQITEGSFELGLNALVIDITGEWYRLVTSGFLHFGVMHLLFNMWLLYQLGNLLEPGLGRIRFGLLYFAALLGGSAGALLMQPGGFHGGASGAVFGLMGAAFVGFRIRGINPFSTGIGTLLVLNLVITFAIPGISIGGHLGGVIAGAICALVMFATPSRYPKWASYAWPALVGLVAVVMSVYAVGAAV